MSEVDIINDGVEPTANIYDGVVVPSQKVQKKALIVDNVLTALTKGEDVGTTINSSLSQDVGLVTKQKSAQYKRDSVSLVASALEHVAIQSPDELPGAVETSRGKVLEINNMAEKNAAMRQTLLDQSEDVSQVSEEDMTDALIDIGLIQAIAETNDNVSWVDTAADIFGLLAAPTASYDQAVLLEEVAGDDSIANIFNSGDAGAVLNDFRRSLSQKERAEFDRLVIVPAVAKMSDNDFKKMVAALNIAGVGETAFEQSLATNIDRLDAGATTALLASLPIKAVTGVIKGATTLKRLSKIKNYRVAKHLADEITKVKSESGVPAVNKTTNVEYDSVNDLTVAKSVGINPMDAAVTGNPLVPEGLFAGAPVGLQNKYTKYVTKINDHIKRAVDTVKVKAGLTDKELSELAASVEGRLNKRKGFENIRYKSDGDGIVFTYDKVDGDGIVQATETKTLTLDDIGGLMEPKGSTLLGATRMIWSPKAQGGLDSSFFVDNAVAAMFSSSRAAKQLGQAYDVALSPIKGIVGRGSFIKSAQKLDRVFQYLNGKDIQPTYQQLTRLGVDGVRLSDKEFLAFTNVRKVLDDAWIMNNKALRDEWHLKGIKSVFNNGAPSFAKVSHTSSAAVNSYQGGHVAVISDGAVTGVRGALSDAELLDLYDNGKVLTKSWSKNKLEWFDSPRGKVEYAIVDRDAVEELPQQVLNKVPNYAPVDRADVNFVIKRKDKQLVDGNSEDLYRTIAYARTETQARRYLDEVVAKMAKDNPETVEFNIKDYEVVPDRELVEHASDEKVINLNGGFAFGHRAKEAPVNAATALDDSQINFVDTVQRYLNVTADRVNMGQWRIEAQHRLIEEVASYPALAQEARRAGWNGLGGIIEGAKIPFDAKQKLKTLYAQTSTMLKIPTQSERIMSDFITQVAQRFDAHAAKGGKLGNVSEDIAEHMYSVKDASAVNLLKTYTYNLIMGLGNVSQIVTQASGMTAAYSIHPISAAKATPRWMLAGMLDLTTNEKTAEEALRVFATKNKLGHKELLEDYKFWRKSGMYDSIIKGNADSAALNGHLPYDAGVLRRMASKVADVGTIPYKIGEAANMRTAFFTALEKEKSLAGAAFKYEDKMLQKVLKRAENLRFNMSSANKSSFQKGLMSLPTQFKNILKATTETLFNKDFTPRQRAQFMTGQIALYGAAGVPLVGSLVDKVLEWTGAKMEQAPGDGGMTHEDLNTIKNGLSARILSGYFGLDLMVSTKYTLATDIKQSVEDSLFADNIKVPELLLGAGYQSITRTAALFEDLMFAGRVATDELFSDEPEWDKVYAAASVLANTAAKLPASSRNYMAMEDLKSGLVRKSDGTPLMLIDPKVGEVYARGLGIQLQEVVDIFNAQRSIRTTEQAQDDLAKRVVSSLHVLANGAMTEDPSNRISVHHALSVLNTMIDQLGKESRPAVVKRVLSILNRDVDPNNRVWKKAVDMLSNDLADADLKFNPTLNKYLQESGKPTNQGVNDGE